MASRDRRGRGRAPTDPPSTGVSGGSAADGTVAVPTHEPAGPGAGPGTGSEGGAAGGTDDRALAGDIRDLVQAVIDAVARAGTVSTAVVSDAVEGAGRSLARRVVASAIDDPDAVDDPADLARALAEAPDVPLLGNATMAAFAARAASRFRPLGFLSRRTPFWLMAAAVPALVSSFSRGARELQLVAAHLAGRARAAGVEVDPERVRRAAVQVAAHRTVDPETEPSHGRLVLVWLRRAARVTLPFSKGITAVDPAGTARRAAAVDPRSLGPG